MPTEIRDGRLVRDPVQATPVFLLQKRHFDEWETVSVWYDRDEAEGWARRNEYRFSGAPWRTYAVSAHGELRDILAAEDAVRGARQGG